MRTLFTAPALQQSTRQSHGRRWKYNKSILSYFNAIIHNMLKMKGMWHMFHWVGCWNNRCKLGQFWANWAIWSLQLRSIVSSQKYPKGHKILNEDINPILLPWPHSQVLYYIKVAWNNKIKNLRLWLCSRDPCLTQYLRSYKVESSFEEPTENPTGITLGHP